MMVQRWDSKRRGCFDKCQKNQVTSNKFKVASWVRVGLATWDLQLKNYFAPRTRLKVSCVMPRKEAMYASGTRCRMSGLISKRR